MSLCLSMSTPQDLYGPLGGIYVRVIHCVVYKIKIRMVLYSLGQRATGTAFPLMTLSAKSKLASGKHT